MLKVLRSFITLSLSCAFSLAVMQGIKRSAAMCSSGGHATTAGLILVAVSCGAGWFLQPAAGQLSWLIALAAFGLARFLRGSAGAPPDPPLLWLSGFGSLLLAFSWWRRRRARDPLQSRAG